MLRESLLLFAAVLALAQDPGSLDAAAAALSEGRYAQAEQQVAAILNNYPQDLRALVLMGAILDSEQRFPAAQGYYEQALRLAPRSPQVTNNLGNHFLAAGDRKQAREFYLKALALDPRHPNARLQMARLSVDDKQGQLALKYLDGLPASDLNVLLLRAGALSLTGNCVDAQELVQRLQTQPGLAFSLGLILAGCKQYEPAEALFSHALDSDPRNFGILYNLGLAALRSGHFERSLNVLQIALTEKPDDPDALFAYAQALLKAARPLDAVAVLAKARKLAPEQAGIALLLAQACAQLEFFDDAAAAYESYLQLRPGDDVARREHAFALACARQTAPALPDLESYVHKHPQDARGLYELAVAQQFGKTREALASLDRALALDPQLLEAHYLRAVLNIGRQQPASAIEDLNLVLARDPGNPRALARLGQAYLDLNQPLKAAGLLEQATTKASDPLSLVQYHRALVQLGRSGEAAAILAQLKSPGPKLQGSLVDFLSLPASEQRARYRANLEQSLRDNPGDPQLRLRLAKELLDDGHTAEALQHFHDLRASSDPAVLTASGKILLEAEQYELALDFLQSAQPPALLDLAVALFHTRGPEAALAELDQTPITGRQGDFYLLRAQLLDSMGKVPEAIDALNHGLQAAPTRAGLYLQAAGFLLKHKLYKEALALLDQSSRILPGNRELLLTQAVTLAVLRRDDDAQKLLTRLEASWPEWDRPYLLHGIMLEIQLKSTEARPLLETAIALGAANSEAYYYETLAITHTAPDDLDAAHNAIARALQLNSKDPYILLLAGKIALDQKHFASAIEQLGKATELLPALIPAHYALRHAYQAAGDEKKAALELEAIQRIAAATAASDQSPFPVEDFIFGVRPPG